MKEQLKTRLNRKFGVNYGETGSDWGEITEVKKKKQKDTGGENGKRLAVN